LFPGRKGDIIFGCGNPIDNITRIIAVKVKADIISADVCDIQFTFILDGIQDGKILGFNEIQEGLLLKTISFAALDGKINAPFGGK